MGVTRTRVSSWDTASLSSISGNTDKIVDQIDNDADSLNRTIDGLHWSGGAQFVARERGDREKRQMKRVATAFDALGKAAKDGAAAMQPMITSLVTGAGNLERDRFTVSDDFVVTDANDYGPALAAAGDDATAKSQVEEQRRQRGEEAANETIRLQRLSSDLEIADQNCAKALSVANDEIESLVPVAAGLNGGTAASDLSDLRDGKATPEELARIHEATQLSPELKDRLARGEQIDLPQGKLDYLQELMRAQDGMSVEDMDNLAKTMPSSMQGDLVNGMQIVSNPQVHAAGMLSPGTPAVTIEQGGMSQLPTQMRTLLTENPIGERGPVLGPLPLGAHVPRGNDFRILDGMLDKSDKTLAHGSDLDRGVLKQVSEIAAATTPGEGGEELTTYMTPHPGGMDAPFTALDSHQLNSTLDGLLSDVNGDHQAVHDFVTGEGMATTVTHGGQYNASSHVMGVLEHKWDADNHGAENMFKWMGGPDANSPDSFVQTQAGETADGLAHIISDNSVDLAPPSHDSLGVVNPGLTQSIAEGMRPYLPNFAGVSDPAVLANHGAGSFDSVDDLSKFFKVLDSDSAAARIVNDAGAQWSNHLAYEAGADPANSALGNNAGQLNHAMQKGLTDQLEDLRKQEQWDNVVEYNKDSQAIDKAVAVAGKIPIPGLEYAGVASAFLKPELLELPNNPVDLANDTDWSKALSPLQTTVQSDSIVREYSLMEGYLQSHPEVISQLTYPGDDGAPRSFVESGHVNWDAVAENPTYFRTSFNALPGDPFADFRQSYDDGLNDLIIDPRTINAPINPGEHPR